MKIITKSVIAILLLLFPVAIMAQTNALPAIPISEIPYLQKALQWSATLEGLPSLLVVMIGCIVTGYMCKLLPVVSNKWIPAIVFVFGIAANLGIQPPTNWVRSIIFGLIAASASIVVHKKLLKGWIDADVFPADPPATKPAPPSPPNLGLWLLLLIPVVLLGCKTPTLEPGGVYAPVDSTGQVVYSDLGLAMADASYKFSYETILSPLQFEKDNRAQIMALNQAVGLTVKRALDKVRKQVWDIDQRWARARQAYRVNPTPEGLSTLKTVLLEIQRIIPVVQSQLAPVYQVLTTPTTTPQ